MKAVLAALAATALALPSAAAVPPKHVAAERDWSVVASRTPEGHFLLGDPAARVRLVEYLSFTCSHCAAFEAEAVPQLLARYVKRGLVAYEVRLALRDGFDLAAATLARCRGPAAFFRTKPVIYAAQEAWMGKAQAWAGTSPDLQKLGEADAGRAIARGAGLFDVAARAGLPPAQGARCFDDLAAQRTLSQQAQAIWKLPGFGGTPGFAINGRLNGDIHDWAGLDAALRSALR